jgi:hypothetical protein
MREIDLEFNEINISHQINDNSQITRMFVGENENILLKMYYFPKYVDDEILCKKKEISVSQKNQVLYKFEKRHMTKQTNIKYEKNILSKSHLHIYIINLYKNKLMQIKSNEKLKKNGIEKNLIQTHETIEYIPRELLIYNLDMNPEYKYFFFSNQARRDFIKKYFPTEYLRGYDLLIPGAFKTDFFRLLVTYVMGGVYMDHKIVLLYKLNYIYPTHQDFILINDVSSNSILNGFIIYKKNHPFLKKLIERYVEKLNNKHLDGNDCLEFGPNFYKKNIDFGPLYNSFFTHCNLDGSHSFVYNKSTNEKILYTGYMDYYRNGNKESYVDLYRKNLVYLRNVKEKRKPQSKKYR